MHDNLRRLAAQARRKVRRRVELLTGTFSDEGTFGTSQILQTGIPLPAVDLTIIVDGLVMRTAI